MPFRGVNCSDAAGGEIGYQSIQAMVDSNGTITGRMYAPELQEPFKVLFCGCQLIMMALGQVGRDGADAMVQLQGEGRHHPPAMV